MIHFSSCSTTSRVPSRSSTSNANMRDLSPNIIGTREAGESEAAVAATSITVQTSAAVPVPVSTSLDGSGGDCWGNPSQPPQSPRVILNCTGLEMETHLDKILECPVCFEVILPPILSCVEGHCWCESCHTALQRCPVCRGEILGVRNLLIEQFLEKCRFKCKFHSLGCSVILPGIFLHSIKLACQVSNNMFH